MLSIPAILHFGQIISILPGLTSQVFIHISLNHFSASYIYFNFVVVNFLNYILILQIYFLFVAIFVRSLLGFVAEVAQLLIFALLLSFNLFLLRSEFFSFDLLCSFSLFNLVIIIVFLLFF